MSGHRTWGAVVALLYVATIPMANWLIVRFGLVPVGFGMEAPAAVYAAGLALVLRDAVREHLGRRGALLAMAGGVVLSYVLATPALAVASAAAFGLAELLDFAVYEPLRKRGLLVAVLGSNVVGIVADSVIFLWLAFGSLAFLPGQLIGKAWVTVVAVAGIAATRRRSSA